MVSPWNVGILCLSSSTSRLAMATPLTSGTLIPSTSEYTRLPTTTFLPNWVCVSANHASVCSGWWFIVIMQNRWSSYSVMVFPGQCLYTSPGSKSSKYRPKGRSCTVMTAELTIPPDRYGEGAGVAMPNVSLLAKVTAQEGKGDELIAAFGPLLEQVENEPGTLLYLMNRSKEDPDLFWFSELYADDDAFAAHSGSDAMAKAVPTLGTLIAESEPILGDPVFTVGLPG